MYAHIFVVEISAKKTHLGSRVMSKVAKEQGCFGDIGDGTMVRLGGHGAAAHLVHSSLHSNVHFVAVHCAAAGVLR